MNKKDALFNDFLSESIEDQTLSEVTGGQQEWAPTRSSGYNTNNASTEGDEGNCDLDDLGYSWHCDN